jgi:hypothetical protein
MFITLSPHGLHIAIVAVRNLIDRHLKDVNAAEVHEK